MIIKKCLVCGKEFKTYQKNIDMGFGKYCSTKCYASIPKSNSMREKVRLSHKGKRHSINTEFKKGNIPYHKGKTRKEEPRIAQPWLGKKRDLETKQKISQSKIGKYMQEKSPSWIKDRTKLKGLRRGRERSDYNFWSRKVKQRDNNKCKFNNKNCRGRLESHHIYPWSKFPEKRFDINNGITLCSFHHPHYLKDNEELRMQFINLIQ
jgi:hypothetical protein